MYKINLKKMAPRKDATIPVAPDKTAEDAVVIGPDEHGHDHIMDGSQEWEASSALLRTVGDETSLVWAALNPEFSDYEQLEKRAEVLTDVIRMQIGTGALNEVGREALKELMMMLAQSEFSSQDDLITDFRLFISEIEDRFELSNATRAGDAAIKSPDATTIDRLVELSESQIIDKRAVYDAIALGVNDLIDFPLLTPAAMAEMRKSEIDTDKKARLSRFVSGVTDVLTRDQCRVFMISFENNIKNFVHEDQGRNNTALVAARSELERAGVTTEQMTHVNAAWRNFDEPFVPAQIDNLPVAGESNEDWRAGGADIHFMLSKVHPEEIFVDAPEAMDRYKFLDKAVREHLMLGEVDADIILALQKIRAMISASQGDFETMKNFDKIIKLLAPYSEFQKKGAFLNAVHNKDKDPISEQLQKLSEADKASLKAFVESKLPSLWLFVEDFTEHPPIQDMISRSKVSHHFVAAIEEMFGEECFAYVDETINFNYLKYGDLSSLHQAVATSAGLNIDAVIFDVETIVERLRAQKLLVISQRKNFLAEAQDAPIALSERIKRVLNTDK